MKLKLSGFFAFGLFAMIWPKLTLKCSLFRFFFLATVANFISGCDNWIVSTVYCYSRFLNPSSCSHFTFQIFGFRFRISVSASTSTLTAAQRNLSCHLLTSEPDWIAMGQQAQKGSAACTGRNNWDCFIDKNNRSQMYHFKRYNINISLFCKDL